MLSGGNKPTWRILASLLTSPSQLKPVTHTNIPAHCFPLLTTNVNKHHQRSSQLTYRYSCNQARNEIQNGIHDQNNHNGVVWPERLVCLCLLNDCVYLFQNINYKPWKIVSAGKKSTKRSRFHPPLRGFSFRLVNFLLYFFSTPVSLSFRLTHTHILTRRGGH